MVKDSFSKLAEILDFMCYKCCKDNCDMPCPYSNKSDCEFYSYIEDIQNDLLRLRDYDVDLNN